MEKFKAIRNEIKLLSAKQREFKTFRKPSNIKEDTFESLGITPSKWHEPQNQIALHIEHNKFKLRCLFQAYAILKGKERPKITKSYIKERRIETLVKKFKENLVT